MKRLVSAGLLLALIALCAGPDAAAGPVRIKLLGRALNYYPGWTITNGLNVVGKGNLVWATVDTLDSGLAGTPAWTLTTPAGSAAALDSANRFATSFKTDSTGFYILRVSYGGQSATDTVYASTYLGVNESNFGATVPNGCYPCHLSGSPQDQAFQSWKNTGHAAMYKWGISGQLETTTYRDAKGNLVTQGTYGKTCMQCHTTGWEPAKNNGNFGYLSHILPAPAPASWDSTWFAGLITSGTSVFITTDTAATRFNAMPAALKQLATIGCESCHGPLAGHVNIGGGTGLFFETSDVSLSAAVCNQCHNGSSHHSIGTYYDLSKHATVPTATASEGGRANCQPCHTGAGFNYWLKHKKDTTGIAASWNLQRDGYTQISCQLCHDPHKAATINPDGTVDPGLRQVSIDSLRNGYKFTAVGASQVCSYCHSSRYSVKAKVKDQSAPYYGFGARFTPHENPQYDMFVGANAYQFGDSSFSGVNTHMSLKDGCVTCHMQDRNRAGTLQMNHSMSMSGDTLFGFKATAVCADCHGEVSDFNDVRAFYDYDRNGRIEGVQTEIQGLLDQVKAKLPHDATGEVTGSGTVTAADSAAVKNRLDLVAGIYNYYFVKNDKSMGVHNAKYAARLLYKTLGWVPTWVSEVKGPVPTTYALEQNYPNPFNPSTKIRFALPKEEHVKLEIFDVTGALVKTLLNEAVRAGNMEVTWDGTNTNGARVTSGMYFYRLVAGSSFVTSKKMLLLK